MFGTVWRLHCEKQVTTPSLAEAGHKGFADEDQLAYAIVEQRAIFTQRA